MKDSSFPNAWTTHLIVFSTALTCSFILSLVNPQLSSAIIVCGSEGAGRELNCEPKSYVGPNKIFDEKKQKMLLRLKEQVELQKLEEEKTRKALEELETERGKPKQ